MLFTTQKITITRNELLAGKADCALTQDGKDRAEKPVEQLLCEMVTRMIENKEEAA